MYSLDIRNIPDCQAHLGRKHISKPNVKVSTREITEGKRGGGQGKDGAATDWSKNKLKCSREVLVAPSTTPVDTTTTNHFTPHLLLVTPPSRAQDLTSQLWHPLSRHNPSN